MYVQPIIALTSTLPVRKKRGNRTQDQPQVYSPLIWRFPFSWSRMGISNSKMLLVSVKIKRCSKEKIHSLRSNGKKFDYNGTKFDRKSMVNMYLSSFCDSRGWRQSLFRTTQKHSSMTPRPRPPTESTPFLLLLFNAQCFLSETKRNRNICVPHILPSLRECHRLIDGDELSTQPPSFESWCVNNVQAYQERARINLESPERKDRMLDLEWLKRSTFGLK